MPDRYDKGGAMGDRGQHPRPLSRKAGAQQESAAIVAALFDRWEKERGNCLLSGKAKLAEVM